MKLKGAGKGELDRISIKKIILATIIMAATFYVANPDMVNGVIGDFVNAKTLMLLSTLILYVREHLNHDYSK